MIALGTSVTRALESAATLSEAHDEGGARSRIASGPGTATLKLTSKSRLQIVGALIPGFHESGASHFDLLASFLNPELLQTIYLEAQRLGYHSRESGDSCLIL